MKNRSDSEKQQDERENSHYQARNCGEDDIRYSMHTKCELNARTSGISDISSGACLAADNFQVFLHVVALMQQCHYDRPCIVVLYTEVKRTISRPINFYFH